MLWPVSFGENWYSKMYAGHSLKERFGFEKDLPIGAVLDYKKDAASDTRTRFVLKLR